MGDCDYHFYVVFVIVSVVIVVFIVVVVIVVVFVARSPACLSSLSSSSSSSSDNHVDAEIIFVQGNVELWVYRIQSWVSRSEFGLNVVQGKLELRRVQGMQICSGHVG